MKGQKSKQHTLTNSPRSAHLKSSSLTKTKKPDLAKRLLVGALLVVLWLLASYLFFRRFPNNYRQPNFFGEEGYVWSKNIIHHGFWTAFFTTFNGYYIWVLYILEKIAFVLNDFLYGGQFADLPRAFSLVSYGFLGLMAILPLALLRKYIKLPALILASLLVLYVPLKGWDYGVIGDLGNMKFAVVYLAFLLLIYRHYLPKHSKKFYVVDIALLLCAYTNITVYVMLPFALLRYWPEVKSRQIRQLLLNAKHVLLTESSAQSLVVLGLAMLPQLYIIKHDGIPPMPGYLTWAYNPRRTVEIFVARSYLYEVLFNLYHDLNDTTVIITMLAFVAAGWRFAGKYRSVFWFGLVTIFLTTFLFVIKRTGVSSFYVGYRDAGPDQFFFAQNWIFGFIFAVVLVEIIGKLRSELLRIGIYALLAIGFLLFMAPQTGSFGKNNFEETGVGNIYAESKKDCATKSQVFNLAIYPTSNVRYSGVTRQQLCTPAVLNY